MSAWFYYFDGQRAIGPLRFEDMLERIGKNQIGPYQLMFRDGETEWRPALAFPEFREALEGRRTERGSGEDAWIILKKRVGSKMMETAGPFSSEELRQALLSGKVEYVDYIWKEGMHQWRRIGMIKEFSPTEKPSHRPLPEFEIPELPEVSKTEVLKSVVTSIGRYTSQEPAAEPEAPPEAAGEDLAKVETVMALPDAPPQSEPEPPSATIPTAPVRNTAAKVERRRRKRKKETSLWYDIYNFRIVLPTNWLQLTVIGLLLAGIGYKLSRDHMPELPTLPGLNDNSVAPPPPAPPQVQMPSPPVPVVEEMPRESRPPPVPIHRATRLRVRMDKHNGEPSNISIETDASPDQVVWVEIVGGPGMVLDQSHYFKKWKWSTGQPFNFMGGAMPAGYYRLRATTGDLVADEHFEFGTSARGFTDRLRWQRKHSYNDFWSERKRLYLAAREVGKLLPRAKRNGDALERVSHFASSSVIFYDLWSDLRQICRSAPKQDLAVSQTHLTALQGRISQLSVWH